MQLPQGKTRLDLVKEGLASDGIKTIVNLGPGESEAELGRAVEKASGGAAKPIACSIGQLIASDEAYKKAVAAVDKLNAIIDELQQGKGAAGRFLKDPALYDNANETISNVRKLTDDINAGKGAIGKLARDQEFANKLQNTMNKLSTISDRMEAGEGTFGLLLKDPALYNNSNQMLLETRELVKAIRENPKKYLTFHVKVF